MDEETLNKWRSVTVTAEAYKQIEDIRQNMVKKAENDGSINAHKITKVDVITVLVNSYLQRQKNLRK